MASAPMRFSVHGRLAGFDDNNKAVGIGIPTTLTIVAAAGSANQTLITFTLKDYEGNTVAEVRNMDIWLSDAATGAGLTATTSSGTVAVNTSGGADIATLTTKKALRVQTLATGIYVLAITDSAKTTFYPCAQIAQGSVVVGTQLVTGSYG